VTEGAHELLAHLQGARHQLENLGRPDKIMQACITGLGRLEALLARLPRVTILGEVNSGKTSVADLLLGVRLLPASVVANTRLPLLIYYAETAVLHAVGDRGRRILHAEDIDELPADIWELEIGLPIERLREFEIRDTPALAHLDNRDAAGDIRIWCTVATRAWTESERARWSALPRRHWHNALLVATHRDALEDPGDAAKVEWRLRRTAGDMFRDVVIVSATDAGRPRGSIGRPRRQRRRSRGPGAGVGERDPGAAYIEGREDRAPPCTIDLPSPGAGPAQGGRDEGGQRLGMGLREVASPSR
jgi:hypothetical protein